MKKLLALLMFSAIIAGGCKKEDKKTEEEQGFVPKGNFVFKLDGVLYDLNAKIRIPSPGIYQLYWDSTDNEAIRNILLTINSNVPRTYPMAETLDEPNRAQFSFIIISGQNRKDYISLSGNFELKSVIDNKWTADFSCKVKDRESNNEFELTEGRLINVPQD